MDIVRPLPTDYTHLRTDTTDGLHCDPPWSALQHISGGFRRKSLTRKAGIRCAGASQSIFHAAARLDDEDVGAGELP